MRAMTKNPDQDLLHRFLFENTPIRGNTVHLNNTYNIALQHTEYPPLLKNALGELMAAAALLAATLKLQNGALILQIQGKGPLKLLVVECSADLEMRATAKWDGEIDQQSFQDLVGNGQFVITLDPKDGGQTYQGIVSVEGDSISQILENYMQRSEQIETRIWLSCDQETVAGMLLQKLPDLPEQDADAWTRAGFLAENISKILSNNCKIIIVTSGAVALGRIKLRLLDKKLTLPQKQSCASVGQIELMSIYKNM